MIGPEGGFSDEEVGLAREGGIRPVSLGPRILRMETAAIIATAFVVDCGSKELTMNKKYPRKEPVRY